MPKCMLLKPIFLHSLELTPLVFCGPSLFFFSNQGCLNCSVKKEKKIEKKQQKMRKQKAIQLNQLFHQISAIFNCVLLKPTVKSDLLMS